MPNKKQSESRKGDVGSHVATIKYAAKRKNIPWRVWRRKAKFGRLRRFVTATTRCRSRR